MNKLDESRKEREKIMSDLVPVEIIANKIFLIRGQKVMLDRDLAELYGVDTAMLKRQVRRNKDRFPNDFMFTLNDEEVKGMVCHFGIPSKSYFGGALPYAFTEQGVSMLSSVLNSKRAIQVNIQIMRTFTQMRQMMLSYKDLKEKIDKMESKYDKQFHIVFQALKQMLELPKPVLPKQNVRRGGRRMGF